MKTIFLYNESPTNRERIVCFFFSIQSLFFSLYPLDLGIIKCPFSQSSQIPYAYKENVFWTFKNFNDWFFFALCYKGVTWCKWRLLVQILTYIPSTVQLSRVWQMKICFPVFLFESFEARKKSKKRRLSFFKYLYNQCELKWTF